LNDHGGEFVEVFLREASERLQFLREYSGILQDPYPRADDVERLYIAAHALDAISASYGFPLFAEIAAKLAHIFQYFINTSVSPEAATLVEFISEAVALLESDLIVISTHMTEAEEDISAFKVRYPFTFRAPGTQATPPPALPSSQDRESAPERVRPLVQQAAALALEEGPAAIASQPFEPNRCPKTKRFPPRFLSSLSQKRKNTCKW
jgi:hypothetical protein